MTRYAGSSVSGCAIAAGWRTFGARCGNIADFCAQWSGEYDYMIVLDADSLMGLGTVTTLIGAMDANPRAGLIQTVPYAVGREDAVRPHSAICRAAVYAPAGGGAGVLAGAGRAITGGHNAIIRIAPFMAQCELPTLPGREPFGGETPVPRRCGGGDDAPRGALGGVADAGAGREL